MNLIVAILVFSVVVIVHELGHFLLAVQNGIFVTEFSLGMGPRIISWVKTEKGYRPKYFLSQHQFEHTQEWNHATKYSIKILPLGGSCMMMGEDEISDDDRAFNKKSVWARISVIFAGPFFNFILAFILAIFIIGNVGYDSPEVMEVAFDSASELAGIEKGDVITHINGKSISLSREFDNYFYFNPVTNKDVTLTFNRNGERKTSTITPIMVKNYMLGMSYDADNKGVIVKEIHENLPMEAAGMKIGDMITAVNGVRIETGAQYREYMTRNPLTEEPISITYSREGVETTVSLTPLLVSEGYDLGVIINSGREKTDVLGVLKYSGIEVKFWIVSTMQGVGKLVSGKINPDQLAGPVAIFGMIGDTYEQSKSNGTMEVLLNLAFITIMLSANLGVINLLPLPALDGGRLVFLFLEVFRGKPIDQNKEGLVHMIGIVALMILMVFVLFNDLNRIF